VARLAQRRREVGVIATVGLVALGVGSFVAGELLRRRAARAQLDRVGEGKA